MAKYTVYCDERGKMTTFDSREEAVRLVGYEVQENPNNHYMVVSGDVVTDRFNQVPKCDYCGHTGVWLDQDRKCGECASEGV